MRGTFTAIVNIIKRFIWITDRAINLKIKQEK